MNAEGSSQRTQQVVWGILIAGAAALIAWFASFNW
jgi:hypothetical protein